MGLNIVCVIRTLWSRGLWCGYGLSQDMLFFWAECIGRHEPSLYTHCHPVGEEKVCQLSQSQGQKWSLISLFRVLDQELVWYLLDLRIKPEPQEQAGGACL